ncbi:hypothetical protein B0F90DRAFT_138893 [Multifurca ochricompacta]|uniref:Uncharacterized protein n=1 Tax=Multifurca ochricompacta TaxID=376703 RepID=A0AAD4QUF4_9AGAM|nr:hypothetical protein B0F90DRAFT_138893 [Multifurca ochricompacta]
MTQSPERLLSLPRLGGKSTVIIFVLTLIAFVVESQLTQYVQSTLHYRQPFFLFYIVHSSLALTFPLHLLFLILTTSLSAESLLAGLSLAIKLHFAPNDQSHLTTVRSPFPYFRFLKLIAFLTLGVTIPALLWFVSVSLSPLSDVTAIWNTNAFFAYIIAVRLFKLNWEVRKLLAVLIATFGVMAVVYGDATESGFPPADHRESFRDAREQAKPKAPLIGDLLTLCASVGYGLYQVMYKRHAALPSDPEYESGGAYAPIPDSEDLTAGSLNGSNTRAGGSAYPPPFGLYPNLVTCGIGLMTLYSLWIILPVLHYSGYERFRLPHDAIVTFSIAGIAISGLVFNAGLMILLGIWGPIVVSVGNLLTIVLVFLSDISVGQGVDVITPWNWQALGELW